MMVMREVRTWSWLGGVLGGGGRLVTFTAAAVMVSKSLTAAPFSVVEFRQQMEPVSLDDESCLIKMICLTKPSGSPTVRTFSMIVCDHDPLAIIN